MNSLNFETVADIHHLFYTILYFPHPGVLIFLLWLSNGINKIVISHVVEVPN